MENKGIYGLTPFSVESELSIVGPTLLILPLEVHNPGPKSGSGLLSWRRVVMKRMLRVAQAKCPLGGFFSVLLIFSLPHEARAHASLVRAQPAPGAVVQSPTQIDLWFNERLEDGFNSVAIMRAEEMASKTAQQSNLARRQPVVDPRDRAHLTLQVGSLPAGNYVAEWRVLSRDGHTATGQFPFQVVESHRQSPSRRTD